MADDFPRDLGPVSEVTRVKLPAKDGGFFRVGKGAYLPRKIYAAKTYKFIYPSDSCPYRVGFDCEVRGSNVYEKNKGFYTDTCCKSRYFKRCRHFADKVATIQENKYFKATYCCPYLVDDICEFRKVNMRRKNRDFYDSTCTKSEYIKKCPHFLEECCKIKVKPKVIIIESEYCPYLIGNRCKIRNIEVKNKCKDFFDYSCSKKKYDKCCPYYAKATSEQYL